MKNCNRFRSQVVICGLLVNSPLVWRCKMSGDIVPLKLMTRQQVLDLYFMEARSKIIDIAAFMDRVDRADGAEDFRMAALREALKELHTGNSDRAKRVLLSLSDPSTEPIPAATTKAATGAWPGRS